MLRNKNQSQPFFPCRRLGGLIAAMFWLGPWVVADAEVYQLPSDGDDVVGRVEYASARQEDTLIDIARRTSVGQVEINMANPTVDRWLPGAGTQVVVPHQYVLPDAPHAGIVVNIPEMRLYYFPVQYATIVHKKAVPGKAHASAKGAKGKKAAPPPPTYVTTTEIGDPVSKPSQVITYPVSMGRMDWRTPLGKTRIAQKVKDPTWTPPESIKREHAKKGEILPDVVPAGPNNPLGPYAMKLGVAGYLIHGTDRGDPAKPFGIGERVTHGCMRMYNEDVTKLYPEISVGTPVYLVNQPIKLGWSAGELYMEVTWPLDEDVKEIPAKWGDDILDESNMSDEDIKAIRAKKRALMVAYLSKLANSLIEKENAKRAILVDRSAIKAAVDNPSGIPVAVGKAAEPPVIETAPGEYPTTPYGAGYPPPSQPTAPAYGYPNGGQPAAGQYHAPQPVPNASGQYGQPSAAYPYGAAQPAPRQYGQPPASYPYGNAQPAQSPYGQYRQPAPTNPAPSGQYGQPSAGNPYGNPAYPSGQYGQQPPAAYPYGSGRSAPSQYPGYPTGQDEGSGQAAPTYPTEPDYDEVGTQASQPYEPPTRPAPAPSAAPDPFAPEEEEEE